MIGVGNAWRGDDAAGLEVARRVGGQTVEGDCTRLVDAWSPDEEVVIVDAAQSGDATPAGTVHRFDARAASLPARVLVSSTHAVGVPEAIELARALERLPARLRVYAIEGADFSAGAGLSPAVEQAVESLARELGAP